MCSEAGILTWTCLKVSDTLGEHLPFVNLRLALIAGYLPVCLIEKLQCFRNLVYTQAAQPNVHRVGNKSRGSKEGMVGVVTVFAIAIAVGTEHVVLFALVAVIDRLSDNGIFVTRIATVPIGLSSQ